MSQDISGLFVYDGSRILQPLTSVIGLPIDQVNFLVCQLIALVLGYIFRTSLSPQNVSPAVRHTVQIVLGLTLTYFCFGSQILHLFAQTLMCYILMNTLRPGVMEKAVFVTAMLYLAICHIYRVLYDYGGYTLDITGPLMVNTQRLACLAYSLKDGSIKDDSKLSPTMRYHASKKWPGLLEFGSYVFCFTTTICGPFCFYKDYISFIEGTNYNTKQEQGDKSVMVDPPSPVPAMLRNLAWVAGTGVLMMLAIPKFPVVFMREPGFYEMSLFQKTVYMVISTTLMRQKYYFAWKLGQAVNLSSGLGYNKKEGSDKWNLLDNADIVKIETALSLKVLLDNWNKTTTYWLRYVVYERFHNTIAVFSVSALWHGFYSGYYITFLSGAVFINASRIVRRKIRPLFQVAPALAIVYDILTFFATHLSIAYLVFPFVVLEFWPSMTTYRSMYYWYHIAVALVFTCVSRLPTPESTKTEKKIQ